MYKLFSMSSQNVGAVLIDQSLYARYLLCPLTTLVLSDKPVSVCARYLLCPLTTLVLSDEAVSICTACVLFFTTV